MNTSELYNFYIGKAGAESNVRVSKPKSVEEKQQALKEHILRTLKPIEKMTKTKKKIAEKGGQMTLFGLGRIDNCYKYLTMKGFGPTEACFHGESTRGKGTATFTATDKTGHTIPSMNVTKIMTFDKFYDIVERNKAKRVS